MPNVSYFLANNDLPMDASHDWWHRSLPQNRLGAADPDDAITYADYFDCVHRFCAANQWRAVTTAAAARLERTINMDDLDPVSIYLEKHGAFYHPAHVVVPVGDQTIHLVVNLAVSKAGKGVMESETRALTHLAETRPFGWLPQVHAFEKGTVDLFMGDWFDGYHEFHLTRREASDALGIIVWDGKPKGRLLTSDQTANLYRQMAMILTACYDPTTGNQIYPWHHAAGDFVVGIDGDKLSMRLITARGYQALSASAPEDEGELLQALLVFFLHLTLRMRIDRLDGVGDLAWAPDDCLAPIVEGFFQGLDLTARIIGLPKPFVEIVGSYLAQQAEQDDGSLAKEIVDTVFTAHQDEQVLIQTHLAAHLDALRGILIDR